jgi:DNA-directed RNA polymerase specialized sigma24 family protein
LLVVITQRKAAHLVRDEARQKRGGGVVTVSLPAGEDDEEALLREMVSREPTPDEAFLMGETYQRLLEALPNEELRTVAVLRMEGCTTKEIAARLGRVERTVKRPLEIIRDIWSKKGGVS